MVALTKPRITLHKTTLPTAKPVRVAVSHNITISPPQPAPQILLESGSAILLENGGKILLE